jgi:hypothetical protein
VNEADEARLWVIQPLLDAGLSADHVGTLLLRATFECLVGGRSNISDVTAFLGEQPPLVRAAWVETVNRMLATSDSVPVI